jgi:CRISPR/Cas system-associated protein Cas5 (RAMP superfamily)
LSDSLGSLSQTPSNTFVNNSLSFIFYTSLIGLIAQYSSLDESEKKILKTLIESTDEEKKEVYSNTIRECITLIDEKLDISDLNAKDKLLRVKDRLLNDKQEINENFIKNISKLVELRSNLKEN